MAARPVFCLFFWAIAILRWLYVPRSKCCCEVEPGQGLVSLQKRLSAKRGNDMWMCLLCSEITWETEGVSGSCYDRALAYLTTRWLFLGVAPLLGYYLENIPPHIWEKTGNAAFVRTATAVTQTFALHGGGTQSLPFIWMEDVRWHSREGELKGSCPKWRAAKKLNLGIFFLQLTVTLPSESLCWPTTYMHAQIPGRLLCNISAFLLFSSSMLWWRIKQLQSW